MCIVYFLIYIFWITSAIVESMKWNNKYEFDKCKFLDYHLFRFVNSLSVFLVIIPSTFVQDLNYFNLLGHWLLANQVYERIQDKMVRGSWWLKKDTDFQIFGKTFKIKWYYTNITIIVGCILVLIK